MIDGSRVALAHGEMCIMEMRRGATLEKVLASFQSDQGIFGIDQASLRDAFDIFDFDPVG